MPPPDYLLIHLLIRAAVSDCNMAKKFKDPLIMASFYLDLDTSAAAHFILFASIFVPFFYDVMRSSISPPATLVIFLSPFLFADHVFTVSLFGVGKCWS